MKKTLLILALLVAYHCAAQEKRTTTTGIITFEASVPFFENVEAKNESVHCDLNTKKGSITFVVYINKFHFERRLMEDHFNEHYLESKKYPKASFKGEIENFKLEAIDTVEKVYYLNGKINIHGKAKSIRVAAKIKKVSNGLALHSIFTLNTDDFDISIPYIVKNKISKKVTVTVLSVLH